MGFTPLFFAGFMFTAGPRWFNMPEVGAAQLLPAVSTTVFGWLIALVGFHGSTLVAGAGVLIVALAWTTITFKFMQLWPWTFATCAWSLRYGSWFGRPRLDDRPG